MEQGNFPIELFGTTFRGHYITDPTDAVEILNALRGKDCPVFGFDIETMPTKKFVGVKDAALDPLRSVPRLVQLFDGKNAVVFDTLYCPLEIFTPFLEEKKLLAHNAMFELQHCLHNFRCKKVDIGCTLIATKLLQHAVMPDDGNARADLGSVVKSLLKVELAKDIPHQYWSNPELNGEQVLYAARDAIVLPFLAEKLQKGLSKYSMFPVYKLYKAAQMPLAKMQLNGIRMDSMKHRELMGQWKLNAFKAKKEVLAITGLDDLTNSTIAGYLEENLPPQILAVWPRTETGKLKTDADAFSDFSDIDIVEPFSRFQKAAILSSTFGMKLHSRINAVSGRVHTQYKLAGARTGRLSSSSPNLQQAPRAEEFRSLFIPDEGNCFVVADFSQIELRVAAELSQDPVMLKAYRDGLDLHTVTAEKISGKKLSELPEKEAKRLRQNSKAENFGLLFGLGGAKFKHYAKKQYGTELTDREALEAVNDWHELYSGYTKWQKQQAQKCEIELRVSTKTGKVRKLSRENYYGASANTPVQGTASECMLHALCTLSDTLHDAKLINTVHDEIVVECKNIPSVIEYVKQEVQFAMEMGFATLFPKGSVRNLVGMSHGLSWADAK